MPSADDRADTPTAWTSLRRSAAVAKALLGPARGHDALERWVRLQVERTRDPSFAALFADAPRPPGVRIEDYLHRVVERGGLRLLGGIRHFGSDPTRPFVEIVAWRPLDDERAPEDPWHTSVLERVRAVATHEWRAFSPLDVRVLRPEANRAPPAPPRDRRVDQYVHVADVRTMVAPDARTTLAPFDDLDAALALVENRYAALERENPTLARDVTPADRETLVKCRAAGSLHAIRARRAHGRVDRDAARHDRLARLPRRRRGSRLARARRAGSRECRATCPGRASGADARWPHARASPARWNDRRAQRRLDRCGVASRTRRRVPSRLSARSRRGAVAFGLGPPRGRRDRTSSSLTTGAPRSSRDPLGSVVENARGEPVDRLADGVERRCRVPATTS